MSETDAGGSSTPVFKKRTSRPKVGASTGRKIQDGSDDKEATSIDIESDDPDDQEDRLSLQDLIALRVMRVKPSGIELDRLNKGEVRKKKKKQEKKGGDTEENRWAEQMQKGGLMTRSIEGGAGGKEKKDEEDEEDDSDDEEKDSTAVPRLVNQNNFQGETGTVDVDKHMMAYIEEEMKKRRQRGEVEDSLGEIDKAKAAWTSDDELYSVPEKYRKILQSAKEALEASRKNVNAGSKTRQEDDKEEGNATLSSAMLNGVPEVDLGMDHRMKNIEETERAKRIMMEAEKARKKGAREEEEGDFASARFFKYGAKIQSDADILRTAESFGFNVDATTFDEDNSSRHQSEHKRQTATDDAALERFKKRQRNQLKR